MRSPACIVPQYSCGIGVIQLQYSCIIVARWLQYSSGMDVVQLWHSCTTAVLVFELQRSIAVVHQQYNCITVLQLQHSCIIAALYLRYSFIMSLRTRAIGTISLSTHATCTKVFLCMLHHMHCSSTLSVHIGAWLTIRLSRSETATFTTANDFFAGTLI